MPIIRGSTSASPTAHPTTSSPAVSSAPHVQSETSVVQSTNGRRRLDLDPGSGSFLQSHAASAAITRSFLLNLSDKGHTWKTVPDDVKEFYWLEFQDRVQALRETASQPVEGSNESCEPDLRQLFLEAAGGKRKQHVYGMGTKASDFYSSTSFHSTATSRDINVEQLRDTIKQEMMQEMQQEVQMMLESQRQQMREEMREEFRLEMRQLIAEMTRSTRDATAPAPQRDPPHPHSDDDSM